MTKPATEIRNSVVLAASQWVWLDDIESILCTSLSLNRKDIRGLLSVHRLPRLLPKLVERHGIYTEFLTGDEDGHTHTLNILDCKLANHQAEDDHVLLHISHYTEIAFSIPSLTEWMKSNNFGFKINEWDQWMKESYPKLNTLGLLPSVTTAADNSDSNLNATTPNCLAFSELQRLSGYKTPAEVRSWLASKDIPFETGAHNRPFTTVAAINTTIGVENDKSPASRQISV